MMYPFTFYHATSMKAYNLFVSSEAARKKWNASFVDALSIFKVRQETNPVSSPLAFQNAAVR
jgi:hypothetical protein